MPNYKYVPVAITAGVIRARQRHGRSNGRAAAQPANETVPSYGPSRNLDFELELGIFIGTGSDLGATVPSAKRWKHVFGFCLLNDWSARDVHVGIPAARTFPRQILPPRFHPGRDGGSLGASAPRRSRGPKGSRPVARTFDDVGDRGDGGLDITLEAFLATEAMRRDGAAPHRSRDLVAQLNWTVAQMIAHPTSTAANLEIGDLIGSGTISDPEKIELGKPSRARARGRADLPGSGEKRGFHEGRRRDHLPRLLRKPGHATHRLRRMPAVIFAGGLVPYSAGTHFCRRFPVSDVAVYKVLPWNELATMHPVELADFAAGTAESADDGAHPCGAPVSITLLVPSTRTK